ncbi:hypothetical protein FOA52_009808 [Chlamydomonas sp. UWO 241]|nr:hypothetical protein FOA52_009808 [Chlamydomonas sp. UWO 241]
MTQLKATEVTATLRVKVAVVGDSACGKSTLISMFKSKGQKFPKQYDMTCGVDIIPIQVPVPDTTKVAELYLMDSSGSELYREALPQHWNGVYYAMLVFDVTSAESFESCKLWLEEIKKARVDKDRALKCVLVSTKNDLPSQRHAVSAQAAEDWATGNGMEFFAVSSLPPGENVDGPFLSLARSFHRAYEDKVTAYADACRNY